MTLITGNLPIQTLKCWLLGCVCSCFTQTRAEFQHGGMRKIWRAVGLLQNSEIALEAETGGLLGVEAKSEPHCTFQNCVGYKDTVSKQKANQQPAKQKVGDTAQTDHPSALGRLRQEDQ